MTKAGDCACIQASNKHRLLPSSLENVDFNAETVISGVGDRLSLRHTPAMRIYFDLEREVFS